VGSCEKWAGDEKPVKNVASHLGNGKLKGDVLCTASLVLNKLLTGKPIKQFIWEVNTF